MLFWRRASVTKRAVISEQQSANGDQAKLFQLPFTVHRSPFTASFVPAIDVELPHDLAVVHLGDDMAQHAGTVWVLAGFAYRKAFRPDYDAGDLVHHLARTDVLVHREDGGASLAEQRIAGWIIAIDDQEFNVVRVDARGKFRVTAF